MTPLEHRTHATAQRFMLLAAHSFGPFATPVLRDVHQGFKIKVIRDVRRRSKVVLNNKRSIARVYLRAGAPDMVLAHEFGHALHCFYWPEETEKCLQHRAERLAFWCEARLVALNRDEGELIRWQNYNEARTRMLRGPHRVAAQWLHDNFDRFEPFVEGESPADTFRRAKGVFDEA